MLRSLLIGFLLACVCPASNAFASIRCGNVSVGSLQPNENELITARVLTAKWLNVSLGAVQAAHVEGTDANLDKRFIEPTMNPFMHAVHLAYQQHLPLYISPDMIWHLISSAAAMHVNKYSEELRDRFVAHSGKKELTVRRDDFVFNATSNPWHEMIDEFSVLIERASKPNASALFTANFSTTSAVARVAHQLVLMDAMQKYFAYSFVTMCGIPEIRVTGGKTDWLMVRDKAERLLDNMGELKGWWNNSLSEILDQFVNVFDDKIDTGFWEKIYKIEGASGGPYLSGWSIALFPYLEGGTKNRYVWETSWREAHAGKNPFDGLVTRDFPFLLNKVPFVWNYFGDNKNMTLAGGLYGVEYNTTDMSLTPLFGYAVASA